MANTIKLLDCTLRDGGYINNWVFGKEKIQDTIKSLESANIDILEVGFIRNEPEDNNRTVFNSIEGITELIPNKKKNITYAAMAEVFRPIPMELVSKRSEKTIDAVRVIIWKDKHDENGNVIDALQEGFEYCKGFVDRGYELFVQPARVEQYTDKEFVDMLDLYSQLNPRAIYIVDSWGTMYSKDVLHYLKLADKHLPKSISIGYHGHNNMMQAFANAVEFINEDINRELILDSSVYGIGRGAGNLNTELMAKFLNENYNKKYDIRSFFEIYENMIKDLQKKYVWGYTPAYFISAFHHANPQYATWYEIENQTKSIDIFDILSDMAEDDKVLYESKKAREYLDKYNS